MLFFSVVWGSIGEVDRWRIVIVEFARSLGLTPHFTLLHRLQDKSQVVGWLERTVASLNETESESTGSPLTSRPGRAITVGPAPGQLEIQVGLTTPEQFYYSHDRGSWLIANDLRIMSRWMYGVLSTEGVYALLRYAAVPGSLTLFHGVNRVPAGHVCTLAPDREPRIHPVPFQIPQFAKDGGTARARVTQTIDSSLANVPQKAVLYFSGGVDSSLLAARLVRLQRRDVSLLNYRFSPDDHEAQLAQAIAKQLGLTCESVLFDPAWTHTVLERAAVEHSVPFGDISVVPTNHLVASTQGAPAVIEGTGADGAFGIGLTYRAWRRLESASSPLKQWVGYLYERMSLWEHPSAIERFARSVKKLSAFPITHAAVAVQHGFDGIAYSVPEECNHALEAALNSPFHCVPPAMGGVDRLSFLDLVHVCAGQFAAKSWDPLRLRQVEAYYPFLSAESIACAFSIPWSLKCTKGEPKALLKAILAEDLPASWVYRRKTGFSPPIAQIMEDRLLLEFLMDVGLTSRNDLFRYCEPLTLRRLGDNLRHKRKLSIGAYNFLWTFVFASAWLHGLRKSTV